MNSSRAKTNPAVISEREHTPADPFAADIFADSAARENFNSEMLPVEKSADKSEWVWRLPKIARPAIDWTKLLRNLPADFSDDLPRLLAVSLANLLEIEDDSIDFVFSENREIYENLESDSNAWWLTIGIEESQAEFFVKIDALFAVWLVDATLNAHIPDRTRTRDLTNSEIAVLEFLAVNLTHEANRIINAPLFEFRSFSQRSARLITPENSEINFSMLVSTWQTVHEFQPSLVKIYFAPESLKALQIGENRLLSAAPRRRMSRRQLENRVQDVRVRLSLGETCVTLGEVAGFETGDVILIENYNFTVNRNGLDGNAEIFLGDGGQVKIVGAFKPTLIETPVEPADKVRTETGKSLTRLVESNNILRFTVLYFEESEKMRLLEKSMPEELLNLTDQTDGENFENERSEGGGVALENLAVTLRVELEARRLSLAEVGSLRVNQIIQLGARPTDPVNLLIDDKLIARGELVEVDSRLGVRIVQILR